MSDYRVDSVEALHKAGFTSLLVSGVGEVEARDEQIDALEADLQRHKDAIGRIGKSMGRAYGISMNIAALIETRAMFTGSGDYIWPIENDFDTAIAAGEYSPHKFNDSYREGDENE